MTDTKKTRIALVWAQFAPHHLDRAEAAAERLGTRAEVVAVEVASNSVTYADWTRPQQGSHVKSMTLFEGQVFDHITRGRRLWAMLKALARFDLICIGIGYDHAEILLLTVLLRLRGRRVILMTDSKFDDQPRRAGFELFKQIALLVYSGAIVASARSADYMRFLGFRRRPVLIGCDTLSLTRIRRDLPAGARTAFGQRNFVFVGRFVDVKNLPMLISAYHRYCQVAGAGSRRLELVGSGELEPALRGQIGQLGLTGQIDFTGFLQGAELAARIANAAALILVSYSETWGLVLNEAAGFGVPIIATEAVGARDALLRNLVNGVVIENGSVDGLAAALQLVVSDERRWQAMAAASQARADLGDVGPFADSIELLLTPGSPGSSARIAQYLASMNEIYGRPNQ